MRLSFGTSDPKSVKADLLAVPVFEGGGLPERLKRHAGVAAALKAAAFKGKAGKSVLQPAPRGLAARSLLFVGLGRASGDVLEAVRRAAGIALAKSRDNAAPAVAFVDPGSTAAHAAAAAEGFHLADYSFTRHKTGPQSPSKTSVTIVTDPASAKAAKSQLKQIEAVTGGVKAARDLGNEPSNILTPAELGERAIALARLRAKDGLTCRVLGPAEIKRKGMGAFLAVAAGSSHEPRFIHLTYKPRSGSQGRRVALVGKGLTFDSGGISIKPAAGMEEMKFDMCGAAAVLGVFHCIADLGLRHEVHGFIAACDNMPSGSAVKPGDVVKSMAGRTIEVVNTDAEGRLTLVDAITEALAHRPSVVVDLATLTGACAVALGSASGIMSNDDALRDALVASSRATGERAWPLPLFEDYKPQLKSETADVKNLGDRYGGALTAGLFIQEWVPEDLPWAHLDIAGSAWTLSELPCCPKGATGIGVRTLVHWLRGLS